MLPLRRVWKWLKSKFQRKGSSFDIYHPRERLIYTYWDGEKEVKGDPLILYKKLMSVGPELDIDIKLSMSPLKDASKGHDGVVKKIRGIFDVKPLEQNGLSELETLGLLDHFLTFTEEVKKNSSLFAISWTPSEQSQTPTSQENQTTLPSSDSGSTGKGFSTDAQDQSPTEPQPPLATSSQT